jgi:hypothetical protein
MGIDARRDRRRARFGVLLVGLFAVTLFSACDVVRPPAKAAPWTGSATFRHEYDVPNDLGGVTHIVDTARFTLDDANAATEQDHGHVQQPVATWTASTSSRYADGCYYERTDGSGSGGPVGTEGQYDSGGFYITFTGNSYSFNAFGIGNEEMRFPTTSVRNPGCLDPQSEASSSLAAITSTQGTTNDCRVAKGTATHEGWTISWNFTRAGCHIRLDTAYSYDGTVSASTVAATGEDFGEVRRADPAPNPRVTRACLRSQWTATAKRSTTSTAPLVWNGESRPFAAGSQFQFVSRQQTGEPPDVRYSETVRTEVCGNIGADLVKQWTLRVTGPGTKVSLAHFSSIRITSAPGQPLETPTRTIAAGTTSIQSSVTTVDNA